MKKAILPAMIAALLATSAQAATVYDADGTTADVYGRMQFDIKDDGTDSDGVGSARMGFKAVSFINSHVDAMARGEWQIAAENSKGSQFTARHLYAGFQGEEMGSLVFGQTDTAFYQVVGVTDMFNTYGYNVIDGIYRGRQEGQIIYSGEFSGFSVGASYQFQDKSKALDNSLALALGYQIQDVALKAGYSVEQYVTAEDKKNYGLSATYTMNDLYLAAVYAESKQDGVADFQGYDLFASYNVVAATTVYGGYGFKENTVTNTDTVDEVTLGAQYDFNAQLKTWIEYQADMVSATTADKHDDAVTVALQYNF
ncbi:porin, Gram-negative type [Psychromonas ingrahamii 37]|uniref:Porin, Gram-negative type n=1 Tax=Psychromonas ingrahamii (strain DSM 17664 / CCUG 51855 / 37) TaxID=357804 RepID=A1SUX6_PSYIN|nr:porin [Psychromonas ingrahamii]ABM03291.1 porin, Gram-negative type [Psychromonas ingrahamii 37]